jgi:pyrroline-5-carboxylate reductase
MTQQNRIGFVGAGNMATALLRGLLRAGVVTAAEIQIADLDAAKAQSLAKEHGVVVSPEARELARWATTLILAVKPQSMPAALAECATHFSIDTLVISVAAGVRCDTIAAALPSGARVIRAMPNTPALVGAAATALCAGPSATAADRDLARRLFDAVGRTVVVDESHMDAVTGLSGSGPAYVMVVIEALADGGVRAGLSRETALLLATQTVLGSAQLLLMSGDHPAEWKDRVMSPGGTTSAGLEAIEAGRLRHTLGRAVQKATLRAQELSRK